MNDPVKGKCLCGGVAFEARFDGAPELGVCHCRMCQVWNGGPGFAGELVGMQFQSDAPLKWYASSDWAERGFCSSCGSNLFFRLKDMPDKYYTHMGCLDLPEGVALAEHIFIDEKPAYYDFRDDAPRFSGEDFLARLEGTQE